MMLVLLLFYLAVGVLFAHWFVKPAEGERPNWYLIFCIGIPTVACWPMLFVGYGVMRWAGKIS